MTNTAPLLHTLKPELIIFDCDGTLVDSEVLNNQATLDVLSSLGVEGYTLDHAFHHWMGTTYSSIALTVQMERNVVLPEDFVRRCIARVAELQQVDLRAVMNAADLVDGLTGRYASCVASNGERTNVINSIHLTGLNEFFPEERIFTKIQVKNPKPAPDLFLFAAEKMGVVPEACLVIEDSEAGVTAGVAAGMIVVGFIGTSHDRAKQEIRLKNAGAHFIVDDLIHIKSMLSV